MHPARPDAAGRAYGPDSRAAGFNTYRLVVHVYRHHRDIRDRREQQLLQPEHHIFHESERSSPPNPGLIIFGQLPGDHGDCHLSLSVAAPQLLS
ncbi:hypothetical protein Srufu_000150 [Streptomyces libani subsp. rufus]|nr:hypothetical protein Srufu_000150 [Streptomyces libani subsp. rufus]